MCWRRSMGRNKRQGLRRARRFVALAALVAVGCQMSRAQASQAPAPPKKPPAFQAAGVQGNIAPSGYSAGAREEETRQVADLAADLQAGNFADELPESAKLPCARQRELLHAALSQPGGFEANLRLGLFYLQHGSPALGEKYLRLAAVASPADPSALRYLAMAALEAKDYAGAAEVAAKLLAEDKPDAVAHRIQGAVAAAAAKREAAVSEYQLAAALDPGAGNLFASGLALLALGAVREAEQVFASGAASHPESAKLWLGRGMAEILAGKKSPAVESLLRAVALDPGNLLAHTLLATQAGGAPATDARILAAAKALAASQPAQAIAHYDYALALAKTMDDASPNPEPSAEVESQLKSAIAEQPQFAAAHFQLGVAYEDSGNPAAAIEEFAQANRIAPELPQWHYRLARTYRAANRPAEADSEMRLFRELKAKRDAGDDLSAKLVEGLPPESLGSPRACPSE